MLTVIEPLFLLGGAVLVLTSLTLYSRRQKHLHGFWQVWVGKLKDFTIAEFRFYRMGILFLFIGIVLRIVNLTMI
ncbi:hypothetical protein FCL40_05725 [Ferrimonas sediminicola]|uniref:Uncharacterized protein n=1 Tax=Ferrimonas sediminicola TaxID=2569538 RepID=A0A4U1BHV1_9GAMM|nr:hypothetical protein [Ferrimonas sediminicola]TKB50647.1 hypothetical protein FCL40_05725 [Ferrimonas sediminicola]